MPTFSFPSTTGNLIDAAAAAAAPAANATDKPVIKKTRNTKKATNTPAPAPVPAPDPAFEETAPADVAAECAEDVVSQPTFPDIVILKQNDKNYIVKHNHYSVVSNENAPQSGLVGCSSGNHPEKSEISDLVSPNQIYKGQINKKRGRKPKAGFILNSNSGLYDTSQVPNIILHLKCHLSDLKSNESIYDYTPSISEVESYNLTTNHNLQSSELCQTYNDEYDSTDTDANEHTSYQPAAAGAGAVAASSSSSNDNNNNTASASIFMSSVASSVSAAAAGAGGGPHSNVKKAAATESAVHVLNERYQKEIAKKINRLKYSFHNGETIQMKLNHKCACFWDTCEFDGPTYYLPIMVVNGVFHVSGCFCSPECALASLLKEQLDTSTKFERIHLLHLLYGSSSNKGFKPAPNPNYLLDKYYGNLTIEEYRSLLKSPQMIHIVNKPLTHILPELYEDNNDFLVNSKVIPTNNLKLKKRYKTMVVQGGAE
jgi:hypothetical protein